MKRHSRQVDRQGARRVSPAALSRALAAAALLLLLVPALAAATDTTWYPDRRRDQFPTEPGHVAVPLPFNLEGIGWGVGVLGALTNVAGSCTDISGAAFGGDVTGGYLAVDQLHLLPRRLVLDLGLGYMSQASVVTYNQRGMNSDQDDYSIVGFGEMLQGGLRLTATFIDRRLEGFFGVYGGRGQLASIRDPDGNVVAEAQDAPTETASTWIAGARLDLTDDAMDPRRGLRCEGSIWRTPPSDGGPDSYLTDFSVTAYVPIAKRSTWAFTYFHSDAHVLDEGETDPAAIAADQGLACDAIVDPLERDRCLQYVDTVAAENRYGSATSLGGSSRLRSYGEGRFRGAHSRLIGTELRWNLTDEKTPFNILIMKDIRTAFQIAFFYEIGTVADKSGDLWSSTRSSYGAGFRMVTASGIVYRVDLAFGDEGFAPTIFFMYPWEI